MQSNFRSTAPVLINDRPPLEAGRFGLIPHTLLTKHRVLSAPAFRMLLYFTSNATGFSVPAAIVEEHTGIKANKISMYRQELCEKGFIQYGDGKITILWPAILASETQGSSDVEGSQQRGVVDDFDAAITEDIPAPSRGIDIPSQRAHNIEHREAATRRKNAIRMSQKKKWDRINSLTDSELTVALRLDETEQSS